MGIITIVAGILVLSAFIWWVRQPQTQQASVSPTPDPESASINQGIDNINVLDLNTELDAIDKDLQGL